MCANILGLARAYSQVFIPMPFSKARSKFAAKSPKRDTAEPGAYSVAFRRFLHSVSPRVVDIVSARYGAGGKDPMTLEEIGRVYGITRERVRQIVSGLLGDVRGKRISSQLEEIAKKLEWTLEKHGGILKESCFFEMVAQGNERERGAVRFFLAVLSDRFPVLESPLMFPSISSLVFDISKWRTVHQVAFDILSKAGSSLAEKDLLLALRKNKALVGGDLSESVLLDFLLVSRDIQRSAFGRWGFPEWSDICPRGTKERAYLVVKAEGKPLHFREIAQRIDARGLQKLGRATHPQTVHNELIKDKRFVLVGRGTYALAEWGYHRGTVREVIEEILRDCKKPLSKQELISRVLKVRDVKESTVVINLNTFFERVGSDSYELKA